MDERKAPALGTARASAVVWVMTLLLASLASSGSAVAAGSYPEVELALVAKLDQPVYVTHAGDDRLFIVERDGRVLVFEGGRVLPAPFLDIRPQVAMDAEGGFLSIAFHPEYASNDFFFVSYTERSRPPRSVVSRYRVSVANPNRADPASVKHLLRFDRPSYYHNGGQLQFGPKDGYLYASFGDGGGSADPRCFAQQDDSYFGKLLRLDVNRNVNTSPYYGVPPRNPFAGTGDPQGRILDLIWAKGLRNPWRFSFDRETGDLYLGDSGHHTREEVDFQTASSGGGENYGWKLMEGNICLKDAKDRRMVDPTGRACPPQTPPCYDPRYTAPIFDYDRSQGDCAVIGGYVYRGNRIPSLRGAYLFSDFCGARIWALERGERVAWERTELLDGGAGITSFGEDLDGELYVTVGDSVYRIEPAGGDWRRLGMLASLALVAVLLLASLLWWRRRRGASAPGAGRPGR